jgi:hypothetical protein
VEPTEWDHLWHIKAPDLDAANEGGDSEDRVEPTEWDHLWHIKAPDSTRLRN